MSDIYSTQKRSDIMSKISGNETKMEIIVRKFLFSKGFRYRKNDKHYPGKPDIILPKYKTAIFVNGCFWHGHNCPAGKLPETNVDFWSEKINSNIERDKRVIAELNKSGWQIITIWECSINTCDKKAKYFENLKTRIFENIRK